ncbi:MAG TPA: hypothetical protein VFM65_09020 [Flavobacteriaceae bacterium]|nr:hypothetical protein [Flavobacteriaceae bacterium]
MIKILGMILSVLGMIALVIGVLGIFGSLSVGMSPWALAIIGFIFFVSGIGLLKRRKDTDEIEN